MPHLFVDACASLLMMMVVDPSLEIEIFFGAKNRYELTYDSNPKACRQLHLALFIRNVVNDNVDDAQLGIPLRSACHTAPVWVVRAHRAFRRAPLRVARTDFISEAFP